VASVFISFVHEEQPVAEAVQHLLEEQLRTRDMFISSDQWQVFAGEDWLRRIREELESAKVVVLLLSPKSVQRPWVNFEAGAAWVSGKTLVPACFGGLLKGTLPKPYSSVQALDLAEDPNYLVASVAHHLGSGPPPPLMPGDDGPNGALLRALRNLENETAS
jgi:hypothetical protein